MCGFCYPAIANSARIRVAKAFSQRFANGQCVCRQGCLVCVCLCIWSLILKKFIFSLFIQGDILFDDLCMEGGKGEYSITWLNMMMSLNWNIFHVTGHLCGEFTGRRWIPLPKANDAGLWCFLWSAPEQTVEKTIETPMIWDAIALIMTSL